MVAAEQHDIPLLFVTDGSSEIIPLDRPGFRVDLSDPDSAVKSICDQLPDCNIRAVIAPDEKIVEIAASVSATLGFPHNPVDALRISSNKFLARKTLEASNLPVPDFRLINLNQELNEQIDSLRFPCVAKPLSLSASRGVIRADSVSELIEAISRIKAILAVETSLVEHQKNLLVEEYIPGSEHALEGYLVDGELETICIFDKPDPLEGPYFEETYYITPSTLDGDIQRQIKHVIQESCLAYGLRMGPVHAEVRVYDGQVWILEVAARSIGGDCGRLFELATNSSLEETILCRSMGKQQETIHFNCAAGVLMIPVTEDGIVRRVEGVTEAQSIENILEVRIDVRESNKLTRWPEGGKYPGFIFAQAQTPEIVESSLRKAYSLLKFVCLPEFPVFVEHSDSV